MLLKATKPKSGLPPEGTHSSTLAGYTPLPDKENPKKVALDFKIQGHETTIKKEMPISFDDGKPLRKDIETLIGRQLTNGEAQDGYDMDKAIGSRCRVVVMHKAGAGGKSEAVVSVVLPEKEQSTD